MIDVWGADHGGYVKRMQAAVKAVSGRQGRARRQDRASSCGCCAAGEPVKMSKRAGDFVTLREVVDEVGRDAVRFMMLYRKNDAPLDFDLAKVIEQSKDNPVFYVQYAHARAHSVFRNAREARARSCRGRCRRGLPSSQERRSSCSTTPAELALMKKIALYPRLDRGRGARPMSRTGLRFISMNWRANFTRNGHAAARLATFTLHYPK